MNNEESNQFEYQIKLKDQELQGKSMEDSKELYHNIVDSMPSLGRMILYIINAVGFVAVCLFGVFGNYDHKDNFWLLLALLPFSLFIPEKKLLHDLIEAFIGLIVSLIKAPQTIGTSILNKITDKKSDSTQK